MGYTTEFRGHFELDKPLTPLQAEYLHKFSRTRRMARDPQAITNDDKWSTLNLPMSADGEFFVDATGLAGQDYHPSIINYNQPPAKQPGLWCQWVPTTDLMGIEWNGGEKFYYYEEWLEYIIENFLKPWGLTLSGKVQYQGEDMDDFGHIYVSNNELVENQVLSKWLQDVSEFHKTFDHPIADEPVLPDQSVQDLRIELVREEFQEFLDAHKDQDIIGIADAISDMIYVLVGAALAYGIPLDQCWDEVQRSNMSKVFPDGTVKKREDGKVLKPDTYSPANLEQFFE